MVNIEFITVRVGIINFQKEFGEEERWKVFFFLLVPKTRRARRQ